MNQPLTEIALVRKLLESGHISVPERQALPNGSARFSLVQAAVLFHLRQSGWFPPSRRPNDPFQGAVIELAADDSCLVHRSLEIRFMQFRPTATLRFQSLSAAVRQYLAWEYGAEPAIDGVPIVDDVDSIPG